MNGCAASFKASIEKRYYEGLNLSFCNNGQYNIKCEVNVNVLDQSAPFFESLSAIDTFKLCVENITPENLGIPTPKVPDNCDSAKVEFTNVSILNNGGPCDTTRAQITWTASDACGNSTSVNQTVVIIRPDANDVVKASDVTLSCGQDQTTDINDFAKTGMPGLKVGRVKNWCLNSDGYHCSE